MSVRLRGIVYSSNENTIYNIREKSKRLGVDTAYTSSLDELYRYLLHARKEIILFDASSLKSADKDAIILNCLDGKNTAIFICKDKNVVNCDNKNIYSCSYAELDNLLAKIIKIVEEKEKYKNLIPEDFVFKYTTETLLSLKVSPTFKGYSYMLQCVMLGIKHSNPHLNLTKDIYRDVAIKNSTTVGNIEKSIRSAIHKTEEIYPGVFKNAGLMQKKITNSILINYFIVNAKLKFVNGNYTE